MWRVSKYIHMAFLSMLFFCGIKGYGQESKHTQTDTIQKMHSPRKASIMSAVVPGLGQIYNKKYWKLPIIYGGIGTGVYFISTNLRNYNSLVAAYVDSSKINSDFSDPILRSEIETSRRFTEISVIFTSLIYVLNIVDASVDAHLFYFNVDDDLTLHFEPKIFPANAMNHTFVGGTLKLNF